MPFKILIVDDEPDMEVVVRQQFRKQIRQKEYEFVFAPNGAEALDYLRRDPEVDLILSDINMPVMDGLTLLTRLNDLSPILRAVIVSAYGDLPNIRTAMNRGALDFLTKPIDFQDFQVTVEKTIKQMQTLKNAIKDRDELVALHRELSIATEIQQSILPRTFPPFPEHVEFDLYAEMHPAREVGGDFYDFFLLKDGRLGLVVGDVSGKGMPAALFMAASRTLLKATALRGAAPGDCFNEVNRLLCLDNRAELFVTVFYAILDPRTGELHFSNGGHNQPFLVRSDGSSSLECLGELGGLFLGAMEDWNYTTQRTRLRPGDLLFLYTDGVTEAMDGHNEQFGEERLAASLQQLKGMSAEQTVRGVVQAVQRHAAGVPASDDLTALALRYQANS
jgi:sigma-B regulation protein RsbU (phosphoserine phosphatase)